MEGSSRNAGIDDGATKGQQLKPRRDLSVGRTWAAYG